jgi:hypothetical protein
MDLFAWDTAYATTMSEVNKALADPKNVLSTFSASAQGMTIQGQFGSWSIVPGGSGSLLHLQTAIQSGSISGGGASTADLSGVAVLLEIDLRFLPSALPNQSTLGFNFSHVGVAGQASTSGAVTPLRVLDPAKKLTFLQQAVLGAGVAQSLVDHASSITFAFANISVAPANSAHSWLTPVSCGYSYFQTGNGDGYLVVLAATDERDISHLSRQVDPGLIDGAATGFFAISPALFLQHVVQPVLPQVYPNTDASFFRFDAGSTSIVSTRSFGMSGVKSGAITYYPSIDSLSVTVSGNSVNASVSGGCDLHMGMSMTFSVSSVSVATFDPITATLSLSKDPNPKESHDSHIPWYDYLMGPLPDLIMAIVVPIVADGIADGLSSAVKGMSFANAGPQSVHWAGMKSFNIRGGQLNNAFRIWGDLD